MKLTNDELTMIIFHTLRDEGIIISTSECEKLADRIIEEDNCKDESYDSFDDTFNID